jgi:hypothetical protein
MHRVTLDVTWDDGGLWAETKVRAYDGYKNRWTTLLERVDYDAQGLAIGANKALLEVESALALPAL